MRSDQECAKTACAAKEPAEREPSSAVGGARPLLTVVIPTLNEAETLPLLLADLNQQAGVSLEIVVGDGGSTDATCSLAASLGAKVVNAERGRGAQMNTAAQQAGGDYFIFLHADCRLDDPGLLAKALSALQRAEREQPCIAGHFRLRFLRTTQRNRLAYRYLEGKTALNRVNTTNGDQGMLLSRHFFAQLGEFDQSLPFLEDQRIAEKIRAQGQWITLPGCLTTSARRFESEGFHRRYLLMAMMMGFYSLGETSFFLRAPGVYRVQQETGRLLLSPFFALVWRMIREDWGFAGSVRAFLRLGRYLLDNAWQVFFFLDVCMQPLLGANRSPLLAAYDRFIAPCLRLRLLNGLAGLLCFVWFMGVLAPFFWLSETLAAANKGARITT